MVCYCVGMRQILSAVLLLLHFFVFCPLSTQGVYAHTNDPPANESQSEYDFYDYYIEDIQDKDDMKEYVLLEGNTDVDDDFVFGDVSLESISNTTLEQDDYEYILGDLEDDDTDDGGLDPVGNYTSEFLLGNSSEIHRVKRGRSRINHVIDPSEVNAVEELLHIESLNSRNLGDYIGSLTLKNPENSRKALEFLARYDMIANERECEGCKGPMSLHKDVSAKHDNYYWKCPDCRKAKTTKKCTMRKGSFFQGLRLTIHQVLYLAADWIENPQKSLEQAANHFQIDKNTVSEVHEWFRDLTQQWWIRTIEEKGGAILGGRGKVVEIDETAMFKAKYQRGSMLNRPTIWVFGLLERKTEKIAMFQVVKRDAATLLPIIERYVAPGTTIISDGWAAYRRISKLRRKGYKHGVINHKLNFVDPRDPSVHTQGIEASWGALKKSLKSRYGVRDYLLQGHLYNYIFRRTNKNEKLLNRLMIEMKFYDRSEDSLLSEDFDRNFPIEAYDENDNDENDGDDDDSDGDDDDSDDVHNGGSQHDEDDDNDDDEDGDDGYQNDDFSGGGNNQRLDDNDAARSNLFDDDVSSEDVDHETRNFRNKDSERSYLETRDFKSYDSEEEQDLDSGDVDSDDVAKSGRDLEEDDFQFENSRSKPVPAFDISVNKKSGRKATIYNQNLEDQIDSSSHDGSESSSSGSGSSGSEYLLPRLSRLGQSRRSQKNFRQSSRSQQSSQEPSGSGLIGTNSNLHYPTSSSPSRSASKQRSNGAKVRQRSDKLEKMDRQKKTKPVAPAQALSVRGNSKTTVRRTMRGRGRKEGMQFSDEMRQQFLDKNKRQHQKETVRGRGSRGGRIRDRLIDQRMVLKKERKQKEEELEESEFPEERSHSPSGMSDEQQNEKNQQLSRGLRGDRNRKHQRGLCGPSQRRGPCGRQVVDGRRSPINLRARPPTEAPTINQRGGGRRGGRTNGRRGARRPFGRGRKY